MNNPSDEQPREPSATVARVRASLRRRRRAEQRFRLYGLAAVSLGIALVVLLFSSVIANGYSAFFQAYLKLDVVLDEAVIDPSGGRNPEDLERANYGRLIKLAMLELFPEVRSRSLQRRLFEIPSRGADYQLRERVLANPAMIGEKVTLWVPTDDDVDMFMKGRSTPIESLAVNGRAEPSGTSGAIEVSSTANDFTAIVSRVKASLNERMCALREEVAELQNVQANLESEQQTLRDTLDKAVAGRDQAALRTQLERLQQRLAGVQQRLATKQDQIDQYAEQTHAAHEDLQLSPQMPSYLLRINQGLVKITSVSSARIEGQVLRPLRSTQIAVAEAWQILRLATPAADRRLSDRQISWILALEREGRLEKRFNTAFFATGNSREPELAGIWGAIVGSFYTLLVTLVLTFVVGVAAAVYLEEFAPKNRFTDLIEVNINNLAAVPSIVFGLLGLAVFINFFQVERSTPLVAGMVLALMTLPTIIISSRSALRSVPPSIRSGALGIGASRIQTITHHVLPLALPGMLTGTIIGMAQALGETAPLLMVGMMAFIVDVPEGISDPATVLPVQIYLWAESPERAFQERTAGAIMVLLGFLIVMSATAVLLRRKLERRW